MSGQVYHQNANATTPRWTGSDHLQIQQARASQEEPGSEESDWETSDEEEKDPDYLSIVDKNSVGAKMKGLGRYSVGSKVQLKLAKNKRETYTIALVHNDQTFDLKDGPGGKTKSRVRQRDLE